MNRPFKFRYAGELAGGLVFLGVALAVAGIVVAGRSQGWFQGQFALHTTFDTPKGSFGLREGNEVIIMNAPAGRVGKIVPTEEGHLEATFILQEHFRQFVRVGSVAKVKKKFGVAGDSFVEIEIGTGGHENVQTLNDGDRIQCLKDEEIMETAQQALKSVQGVALPMLKEVQEILAHANGILALLETGDGLAGSLLHDKAFADDLKGTVSSARGLLDESQRTFRETTRLVEAAQKHWLFRKHVDPEPRKLRLTPATCGPVDAAAEADRYRADLVGSMAADDSEAIARDACNTAVCLILSGDCEGAIPYVMDARSEMESAGANAAMSYLLESEIMRLTGRRDRAFAAARRAAALFDESEDGVGRLECNLVIAGLECDAGNADGARQVLDRQGRALKKSDSPELRALGLQVRARVFGLDGEHARAAECFDAAAAILREAAAYARMADCLASGADAFAASGAGREAADRYFRSARTFAALGAPARARSLIEAGEVIAKTLGDKELQQRMASLKVDAMPGAGVPAKKQ